MIAISLLILTFWIIFFVQLINDYKRVNDRVNRNLVKIDQLSDFAKRNNLRCKDLVELYEIALDD